LALLSPSGPVIVVPSPGSPLFPYTTLFRSWLLGSLCLGLLLEYFLLALGLLFRILRRCRRLCGLQIFLRRESFGFVWFRRLCRRDRKSTRLNSSHVKTSYAVFCLKTKLKST